MGAKATKMEGTYLPDTPKLNRFRYSVGQKPELTEMPSSPTQENNAQLDPRSPNGCRTPLNIPQPQPMQLTATGNENAFAQLRKRILKGFSLNDPRSPQLNRTPLVLDEAVDRTLNMDDTFADLFVETRVPADVSKPVTKEEQADVSSSSLEMVSFVYEEEETMSCDILLPKTPPAQNYDPRSPSVGVERTPIIFCDDEEAEARDTQMLEEVLETLTLNISNGSSMASFVSAELMIDEPSSQTRPANKHLERVRLGNKRRVAPRKPARASKSQIYVDAAAALSSTPKSTPEPARTQQRTPLSCVNKNRAHLRSRSAEKDLKRTQLPLKCFDDQLNPNERLNVSSLRMRICDENNY